ncbi:unnamed protein product [Sphagnum troendelagicum]|jgi:predicted cupin superfamily sugar epimerase
MAGVMTTTTTATEMCKLLNLVPHPGGGFYKESFRDSDISLSADSLPPRYKVERPVSSAIYFLMPAGTVSCIHRIPCTELWHFYAGDPLTVFELDEEGNMKHIVLGIDIAAGQTPQYKTKPMVWFGAYPTKDIAEFPEDGSNPLVKAAPRDPEYHYSLIGCTCAPAFQVEDCDLATRSELLALHPEAHEFIEYLTKDN